MTSDDVVTLGGETPEVGRGTVVFLPAGMPRGAKAAEARRTARGDARSVAR
jgi:quercetin dioxygenase-like cupin family protein